MQWQIGDTLLNQYKVLGNLGTGGFGRVVHVLHQDWNQELAVKIPNATTLESLGGVDNFRVEAQTWVDIGLHPHIVSCYYVRTLEDVPTVFAEYVAGGSLQEWIYTRRLYHKEGSVVEISEKILDIAIQLAWGLDYAHQKNLVHRDIKPSNVMLTPERTVKITDFGLTNSTMKALVNGSGGTLAYFSPEQARAEKLTPKSDLFSWALCLLEMLKAERVWTLGNWVTGEDLAYYLNLEPSLPELSPLSQRLQEILQECLQEDPVDRPGEIVIVANALEEIYKELVGRDYPRYKPLPASFRADDFNNRALSNWELGEVSQAINFWQKALQEDPQHPESVYNYGLLRWRKRLDKYNQFLTCLINSLIESRLLKLSCIILDKYQSSLDDEKFIEDLEGTVSSHLDSWIPKYLLSQVHLERQDWDEASAILESIKNPGFGEIKKALDLSNDYVSSHQIINAHSQPINAISLSPDGQLALSGSSDKTLKLWDLKTGQCLKTFEGHTEEVLDVYLSTDKQIALSGSSDKTLKIWDVNTGNCETIRDFKNSVASVYLSDDKSLILSGETFVGSQVIPTIYNAIKTILPNNNKKRQINHLKIWNLSEKKCLLELLGDTLAVRDCCFDASNQLILSGGADRVLRLWQADTGKCLQIFGELNKGAEAFSGHKSSISAVAFSKYGLISASEDSTLKLWDQQTGACLSSLEGHLDRVTAVAVEKEGNFALSADESGRIKLWDLATGKCLRTFICPSRRISSVALSRNAEIAVVSDFSGTVQIIKIGNLTSQADYTAPFRLCRTLTTEANLQAGYIYKEELQKAEIALQQNDYVNAKIHLEIARQQTGYQRQEQGRQLWASLYYHLPCRQLNGVWLTKTLNFLDISNVGKYHYRKTPKMLGDLHSSLALSVDGNFLVLARSRSMIFNLEVFNFPSLTLNQSLEGLEQVWEQALSAGDKLKKDWTKKEDHNALETSQYLAKQGSNALKMLRTVAGQNAQWSGKNCLNLSADGSLIVCGHQLGRLRLYDAKTGKLIWTYRRHDGEVNSLCISQDKKLILSGGADKTLKVWEIGKHESIRALRQGDCLATFTGHDAAVLSVCLRRDNQFALSGSADHTLRLWQVATGNCIKILTGHTNAVKVVCLDFTGKFAVSASADTTLRYWDLETGACLKVLTGHTAAINCLALSLDGQLLLSGSQDQTARIWNLRTGECLQILEGHRLDITTVALSINNQWAITGDGEQIKVWFLNWELGDSLAQVREGGFSQYLEMFLQEHTPYARSLPDNRKVTPDEITESLMQRGVPIWTDQDLQSLLHILSYVGCGSTGVLTELQQRRNNLILPLLKVAGQRTNYQQLVALLEQNLWQAANEETARIIRSVVNSAPGRNIDLHLWQSFPAADLLILDLLWVHYSQGRFGFSVQKTIFQEVGFQATKQWDRVGDRLGWRLQEKWLFDQDINFTLQAPQGHLPILGTSLNLPVWWFRRNVYLYLISSSAWQSLDTKSYTALNLEEIIG